MPNCIPPLPSSSRPRLFQRLFRQRGFFLIELLAGLIVIALLVTLALPGLQSLVRTHRVRSVAKDLAAEIAWAQAEAVRRGSPMVMQFDSPPSCVSAPQAPGRHCGWDVFMDLNGDGVMQADEPTVRTYVTASDMLLKPGANPLFLDAAGNIRNKGGFGAVGLNVEITLADARASDPANRIVCFNAGGRIRVYGGQRCAQ